MIATILSIVAFAACLAALGAGAAATLMGAIVAVLASPGEWSFAVSERTAGVLSSLSGVLVFAAATTLLIHGVV